MAEDSDTEQLDLWGGFPDGEAASEPDAEPGAQTAPIPEPEPESEPEPEARAAPDAAPGEAPGSLREPPPAARRRRTAAPSGGEGPEKATDKQKVVGETSSRVKRDLFSMPAAEHARIGELRRRLMLQGVEANKSEVVRAGLALLAGLSDTELAAAMERVERLRPGRRS